MEHLNEKDTLANFKGDLIWIRQWEGHVGKPYWPGGQSGVTLDPGVDVGYYDWSRLGEVYRGLGITDLQFTDLERMKGLIGGKAETGFNDARTRKTPFTEIRISKKQADERFYVVIAPYWEWISERFPHLLKDEVLKSVHTVFLSLAFNRGPNNKDLEQLRDPLANSQWQTLGELVRAMQQNHQLKGIRRRRREEGQLILTEVASR